MEAHSDSSHCIRELRGRIKGEVRDDRLSRALYATDASIYEIVPDGVVFPKTVEDVQGTVRACARHRVPLTARGAGTGLAGGAVNRGLQLDCSRFLNRILHVDATAKIAVVEPGVVLDELNAALSPHGLHFAPDVATSSRATIGGMIANNSCGAHSVLYGRTVDHVLSVDVVLSDGSRQSWGEPSCEWRIANSEMGAACERELKRIVEAHSDEIAKRFPKVMRRNGGYALDRVRIHDGHVNPQTVICGSEGTLGVVVGAVLKLTPLPKHRGLVVAHFSELPDALEATPAALVHGPAAVELLDRLILDAARVNPVMRRRRWHIQGEPNGLLIIELYDENAAALGDRLQALAADLRAKGLGYAWITLTDNGEQDDLWHIRKSGLGLLMSKPGDRQTYDFVEDTAVEPARLREYIGRFMEVLAEEGVPEASYYAHASVGCLHVKPILNLKDAGDIAKMHRIADRISSLALEFGGTMTGEHGDGILRSCWLEKMYGPRIVEAFRSVKRAFDPLGILNPGKIVDPLPMLENFRYGTEYRAKQPLTVLDFSAHGGMAGLTEMCSGVGQCRQRLVGTMCPSYMATGDERHTTRARANALRLALSNRAIITGLDDPALDEVMDLCISCKACKSECPTGVDMARLKSEWLHQGHAGRGPALRTRLIANTARLCEWASRVPRLSNWIGRSGVVRGILDGWLGIDARVPLPALSRQTFRQWWESRRRSARSGSEGRVALFVDTWTNYFTPEAGVAAVEVVEALGYDVVVPPVVCCGRPAISKGMLDVARGLAEQNEALLSGLAVEGIPIVGIEPSCVLTFVDEFPQLVRTDAARQIAGQAVMIESFLAKRIDRLQRVMNVGQGRGDVLYHAHCHQKALVGTQDVVALMKSVIGDRAREINSGCCGMAGSFGHEKEHTEVSRAIGEQRLFPAIRSCPGAEVAVSGFSCRHQIAHHTDARPRHVIELLADRLVAAKQR